MTTKTPNMSTSASATRRQVLKGTAATAGLALGSGLIDGFPAIHAADPIVIRYAGTGVNAFRELSEKCKEDIGIEIQKQGALVVLPPLIGLLIGALLFLQAAFIFASGKGMTAMVLGSGAVLCWAFNQHLRRRFYES